MNETTLRVSGVTKRYGSGSTEVTAVRDVSLEVAAGEIVLIMGPSGSGKTTLLLMLGALLKPSKGTIHLNGQVLSDLEENRLPDVRLRHFGFVFQDFNLLSALSVLENVAIVAELAGVKGREARRKAAALLIELGLEGRLNFLPEKLSGGEKQRVAIARALVNDPSVILADEPTANLDSKIGREIMRLLRRIAREHPANGGETPVLARLHLRHKRRRPAVQARAPQVQAGSRSVVIVSHDQRLQEIADRVLWLEDGQFKDVVTMATDPVCGMAVDREQAQPAEWNGSFLYFCARGCRDEFLSRPHDFLPGGQPVQEPGPNVKRDEG